MGGFFSLTGAIGIVRFPDVYSRSHAATKSATLGVISIMLGVFLYFLFVEGIFSGKVLLTVFFVSLTAPVSAFMITRSAYNVGVKLSEKTVQDDLKAPLAESEKQQDKS